MLSGPLTNVTMERRHPENPLLKSVADVCVYFLTFYTKRYAEIPGSGYRKLERVKSSQQDETPPRSTGDVINSGTESSKKSPEPAEGGGAAEGDSEELDGTGRLPAEDFRNQRHEKEGGH